MNLSFRRTKIIQSQGYMENAKTTSTQKEQGSGKLHGYEWPVSLITCRNRRVHFNKYFATIGSKLCKMLPSRQTHICS